MSEAIISYHWHPYRRAYHYLGGIFATACGVVSLLVAPHQESGPWSIFGYAFLICGFALFVEHWTRIDTESHVVSRESLLFGCLRIWFTRYSIGGFTAVTYRRFERVRENDMIYIGLRRQSGKVMEITYFEVASGHPCEHAYGEAEVLAHKLGLPLDKHIG